MCSMSSSLYCPYNNNIILIITLPSIIYTHCQSTYIICILVCYLPSPIPNLGRIQYYMHMQKNIENMGLEWPGEKKLPLFTLFNILFIGFGSNWCHVWWPRSLAHIGLRGSAGRPHTEWCPSSSRLAHDSSRPPRLITCASFLWYIAHWKNADRFLKWMVCLLCFCK